jgi:hypothetical protein
MDRRKLKKLNIILLKSISLIFNVSLMAGNMLFIPLVNSRVDEEVIRKEFEKVNLVID